MGELDEEEAIQAAQLQLMNVLARINKEAICDKCGQKRSLKNNGKFRDRLRFQCVAPLQDKS